MTNLGKYEILEQLGTGSMGTVYRARDSVLDRFVALKTIRTEVDIEPELRERFYREARSCGRLQHPNIVTIFDMGEHQRTAYIAMELLEGADFRAFLERKKEAPLPKKLDWMVQICEALGHAHRHGVVHRDVKPSNLFLTEAGIVKVLDFGIARLPSSRLTMAGKVLGTPNYMAPEQLLARPCDGRADLFSAAVVFFELLVYKHPFSGSNIPQRIAESEPDSLFDYDSNLPVALERIFAQALLKDPERRYATGAIFAADLRAVLEILKQPDTPSSARVVLPSEQSLSHPVEGVTAPALEPVLPPDGEDSAEWRYSEVLRLIPLFEVALQRNEIFEAQRKFDNLRQVTVGDNRFNEAVTGCRVRLEQMEVTISTGTAQPKTTSPKVCGQCGVGNRRVAKFCIECGANLDEPVVESTTETLTMPMETARHSPLNESDSTLFPQQQSQAVNTSSNTTLPVVNTDQPVIKPRVTGGENAENNTVSKPALGFSRRVQALAVQHRNLTLLVTVAVVALLALFLIIPGKSKSYPIETAVATTTVGMESLDLREQADPNSRQIPPPLAKGTTLNVLSLPPSLSEGWTRVQNVVQGTGKQPGFVRSARLTNWKGAQPHAKFLLWRLSLSNEPLSEGEWMQRIDWLRRYLEQYPTSSDAVQGHALRTRLEIDLAKRHLDQGSNRENMNAEFDAATADAQQAGEESASLLDEIAKLRNPPARVTNSDPPPPNYLTRFNKLFETGRLQDAKRLAQTWLQNEAGNSEAKKCLGRANNAIDLENK